jgi:hypothetical protein
VNCSGQFNKARRDAGLPDFSRSKHTKTGTLIPTDHKTIPNGHKIQKMAVNYSKRPWNIPTFSIQRPSKMQTNCDYWYEIKPSGNIGCERGDQMSLFWSLPFSSRYIFPLLKEAKSFWLLL